MTGLRRFLLSVATISMLGLILPATDALAQQRKPEPAAQQAAAIDKVDIQLMVVHAQQGEPYVDPKLRSIERHLQMLRYDSFKVLQSDRSTVAPTKAANFTVQGGRKVTVTLLDVNDKAARVRVEVFKQGSKLVDTTVSINRGSTMMVAGPRYEEGILILPITASY